jgi:plasmid stabilization system protein ParE
MTTTTQTTDPSFNLEALRQCHALEHGTVWVLSEWYPHLSLGGTSTDRGFYIFGSVTQERLEEAAREALRRFQQGAEELAVHPRCGTNLSAGILLLLLLTLGLSALLPRRPLAQTMGLGLAVYGTSVLSENVGAFAQRHITTAIPRNLEITGVQAQKDWLGRSGLFVAVRWVV